MEGPDFLWIKTRDGSPTLWSNEISEPFRSTKGAFSESWNAFVGPALRASRVLAKSPLVVGEFGLGPGTNWVLWTLASRLMGIASKYYVIESQPRYFEAGIEKWKSLSEILVDFVESQLETSDFNHLKCGQKRDNLARELREGLLEAPAIYPNSFEALRAEGSASANLWFHDPFGYAVNPEGYSLQTLQDCHKLWAPEVAGFSYAANRTFKTHVESLPGMRFLNVDSTGAGLKRQRAEFYGARYPSCTDAEIRSKMNSNVV